MVGEVVLGLRFGESAKIRCPSCGKMSLVRRRDRGKRSGISVFTETCPCGYKDRDIWITESEGDSLCW